jgi:hypothetical protein
MATSAEAGNAEPSNSENRTIVRHNLAVIARLDRAIQYSRDASRNR